MKKFIALASLALAAAGAQAKDIVDTAVAAGNFKTLATALQAAGLVDTLKGPGPFTVFAPTDAAFAKIPKADLDALLKDKAKLTAVLTYHVLPGKVMAKDVKAGSAKTVQGGALTLATAGGVTVNGAKVTAADIAAGWRIVDITVCTRPFRAQGPRIEAQRLHGKTVIHHYGHGGAGSGFGSALGNFSGFFGARQFVRYVDEVDLGFRMMGFSGFDNACHCG